MTEFRPGRFQMIPPVIKNLIIINALIFLAQQTFGDGVEERILNLFALHDVRSELFRPHQLVTYLFLHGNWGHIFFNMFALWMFGAILENYWGAKRFLIYYIICGIGAAVCHLSVLYFENTPIINAYHNAPPEIQQQIAEKFQYHMNQATLGASGSVFGCLAAFGYLFPNNQVLILPIPFPIKAKWLVIGYAAIELFSGISPNAGDNVAHWAHLGGAAVGLLLVMYWNRTNRRHFY